MRNLRCDLGRRPAQSAEMADWSLNSKLTDSGEAGKLVKGRSRQKPCDICYLVQASKIVGIWQNCLSGLIDPVSDKCHSRT